MGAVHAEVEFLLNGGSMGGPGYFVFAHTSN